ncbi:hypothetical protein PRIC1_011610 [Phytophthora ramorum]
MADLVPRLMDYVETFPPDGDVDEFKSQLSGCTHRDLRTACSRFNLPGVRKQNKKGGFISLLVSYWKGEAVPSSEGNYLSDQPANHDNLSDVMNEATDVTHFVQVFPPEGDIDELRDQLNGCKARTLRSACVLLELHPKKNHAKPNFVALLVDYWKDSVACTPQKVSAQSTVTPKAGKAPVPNATPQTNKKKTKGEDKGEKRHTKRVREEVEKKKEAPKKKKVLERTGGIFEEEKSDIMAASLEKAKVVKEWASAMEILSRVDGSAESIASIRALIGGVVDSAMTEL